MSTYKKRKVKYENYENYKSILPLEIIYLILSFIDWRSAMSLRLVCKTWNKYFRNKLSYFETDNVKKIYTIYPNISTLVIKNKKLDIKPQYFKKLEHLILINTKDFGNLGKLSLNSITWKSDKGYANNCLDHFLNIVINSKLKSLTIQNKSGYCFNCIEKYGLLHNLEELSLINVIGMPEFLIFYICQLNITKLTLIRLEIKIYDFDLYLQLAKMINLKELVISGEMLTCYQKEKLQDSFDQVDKKLIIV